MLRSWLISIARDKILEAVERFPKILATPLTAIWSIVSTTRTLTFDPSWRLSPSALELRNRFLQQAAITRLLEGRIIYANASPEEKLYAQTAALRHKRIAAEGNVMLHGRLAGSMTGIVQFAAEVVAERSGRC